MEAREKESLCCQMFVIDKADVGQLRRVAISCDEISARERGDEPEVRFLSADFLGRLATIRVIARRT